MVIKYVFLLLFTSFSFSQQLSPVTAKKVFEEIIVAIGNTNPRPPSLIFQNTDYNPASYSPKKKNIKIENKVLEICYSFGIDSLNALAYILAHELGHHYRSHGWETSYASLDFSNEIDKKLDSSQKRIDAETEADIFAGFYAHLAGYDALSVANKFLTKIYESYDLPENLSNYPTLDERKKIIQKNQEDFEKLKDIFDLGNLAMVTGNYAYAQEIFHHILNHGFTSREIYNNLGLCYVYEALSLNIELDFVFPFKIDLSSRLDIEEKTRGSFNKKAKAIDLFNDAVIEFETALKLDPNYIPAKENKLYSNIALSYLKDNYQNNQSFNYANNTFCSCEYCLNGLDMGVQKKFKKAKKEFKKGERSGCDICIINANLSDKKTSTIKEYENHSLTFNDIDLYCLDFGKSDCDIYEKLTSSNTRVCVNKVNNLNFIKSKIEGVSKCISILEIDDENSKIKNSVGVYLNDSKEKITRNFNNLRVINSGNKSFISIADQQLTFLIENNTIKKWYFHVLMD